MNVACNNFFRFHHYFRIDTFLYILMYFEALTISESYIVYLSYPLHFLFSYSNLFFQYQKLVRNNKKIYLITSDKGMHSKFPSGSKDNVIRVAKNMKNSGSTLLAIFPLRISPRNLCASHPKQSTYFDTYINFPVGIEEFSNI